MVEMGSNVLKAKILHSISPKLVQTPVTLPKYVPDFVSGLKSKCRRNRGQKMYKVELIWKG